jgi:hypothetical protein
MIVVDTHVIPRYLVGVRSPSDQAMYEAPGVLFDRVGRGIDRIVTNDAVVAEVVFMLHAPRHYGLARGDVAGRLRVLFGHPGVSMPGKAAPLDALSLWEGTPSPSFVDALTICRAREGGPALATFAAAMARHAGVPVWRPGDE